MTKGRRTAILIYYSGHGKQDGAGNLHLATADTEADTLETSSIAVGTLRRLIDNYACKQVALILDCCFGGAVSKDFLKGGVDDHLKQTFHGRGIYILTASTATQTKAILPCRLKTFRGAMRRSFARSSRR
jgi:uncharacterized caspase-like protein